jgi:hypothetical protein
VISKDEVKAGPLLLRSDVLHRYSKIIYWSLVPSYATYLFLSYLLKSGSAVRTLTNTEFSLKLKLSGGEL